jgi:hypothetical protein
MGKAVDKAATSFGQPSFRNFIYGDCSQTGGVLSARSETEQVTLWRMQALLQYLLQEAWPLLCDSIFSASPPTESPDGCDSNSSGRSLINRRFVGISVQ